MEIEQSDRDRAIIEAIKTVLRKLNTEIKQQYESGWDAYWDRVLERVLPVNLRSLQI